MADRGAGHGSQERSNTRDHSVRTDRGNDISKEKPSFVDGSAGGGGSVRSRREGAVVVVVLVFLLIGSSVIAGASHVRRARTVLASNGFDRIHFSKYI
jgi:hypothetical protein